MGKRLLALVCFVAGPLVLLELLVRLSGIAAHLYTEPSFEVAPGGDYWRYRPQFEGRVLGPTEASIGPQGSRLAPGENVAGALRVGVFGDSITFGQAVDARDTFCAVLERRLRPRWPQLHVLNFGVPGHSLDMEVAHLADRLREVPCAVVVLVFGSDDLNPSRAENHVDRFGFLTKKTFGASSPWRDWLRAFLRQSHLALAVKDVYLRRTARSVPGATTRSAETPGFDAALGDLRAALTRFADLTRDHERLVMCADLVETPLTRAIAQVMRDEFPAIRYIHATTTLGAQPLDRLRVPRDGHPNARAHGLYADLLAPALKSALERAAPTDPGHTPYR
jgi:hypothetical protein